MARIQPLPIEFRVDADPVKFNYYFINAGRFPAIGLIHNESAALPDNALTNKEIDTAFVLLKDSLRDLESQNAESEIQPGEITWFTFKYAMSQDQYKSVTHGDKYLYLLAFMEYRDQTLPKGKWRVTEMCNYTYKGQGLHGCPRHNKIYTLQ